MQKILLPLVFIGVSFLYIFSRSPAAALAGISAETAIIATSTDTGITIETVAQPIVPEATTTQSEAELAARLALLQDRLAKLERTKIAFVATQKSVNTATVSVASPSSPTTQPIAQPASGAASSGAPAPTVVLPPPPPPLATDPVPAFVPAAIPPPPPASGLVPATPVASAPPPVGNVGTGTPAPAPPPAASGYIDGTYTGSVAQAGSRGPVQVQVTIIGGLITDVTFLSSPSAAGTSVAINASAMPILTQEAITAQSASVATVSGATLTSNAFKQSLASALAKA